MTLLHMIELFPDLQALLHFLRGQGLEEHGDEDLGYGVHAWLRAAFGDLAPQPFRLFAQRGRPLRILGYAHADASALATRLREFAEPAAYAVCPPEALASRAMPEFRPGRRLAFELLCCPVARKARSGIEKDLFLLHADRTPGQSGLDRGSIYGGWVKERLAGAASVTNVTLAGFRLVQQLRRTQPSHQGRKSVRILRPRALVTGTCTVADGQRFAGLLARGVGRHRSFGYGMLLLRPPR